jgi:hypothetical protein
MTDLQVAEERLLAALKYVREVKRLRRAKRAERSYLKLAFILADQALNRLRQELDR